VVNILELPTYKKRIRKVSEQAKNESRRLWHNVTQALKTGDTDGATKYKQTVSSVSLSVFLGMCGDGVGGGVSPHRYVARLVRENVCSLNSQNLNVQMLPPAVLTLILLTWNIG
jgi:hypothetical protein